MKKILIGILGILTAMSLAGCMGTGQKIEKLSTDDAPDTANIKSSDYKDNLEGLEKYLTALDYIPEKAEATEMMSSVIGAKDGDRYNFLVNNSTVFVELYEYEPDKLNDEGKRVISEVKENGEFYIFGKDSELDGDIAYPATLSENGKYLLLYTDGSSDMKNIQRKADFETAVKNFYK